MFVTAEKTTLFGSLDSINSGLNVNIDITRLVFNDIVPALSLLFELQSLHPISLIFKILKGAILLAGSSKSRTIILLIFTLATKTGTHFFLY